MKDNLTAEEAALLAVPGDPDLTFDVAGMTLTGVVYEEQTLVLYARGGYGFWIDTDGERCQFRLGDPVSEVETMSFTVDYDAEDSGWFTPAYRLLCRWRDDAVPVRMCAAPGRVSVLIGGGGDTFLPIALTE